MNARERGETVAAVQLISTLIADLVVTAADSIDGGGGGVG